jgi:hypothetical protein
MASTAETAAAALPAIEETEEVWSEPDDMDTLSTDDSAPAEKADDKEETPAAPVEPAVTAEADKTEEDAEKPAAELTEEQQKAKALDDLSAAFARDPSGYLKYMASLMTPEQRAAAGMSDPVAAKPEALWPDEDDTTPAEVFVKKNAHLIQDLPRFSHGVTNAISTHERVIIEQQARLDRYEAQIEALSDAVGLKLPATTVSDAKAYKEQAKQAAAKLRMVTTADTTPTPKTPKNGSGGSSGDNDVAPPVGASFQQMYRWAAKQAAAK